MKKLIYIVTIMALAFLCSVALAQPPRPQPLPSPVPLPSGSTLAHKLNIIDDLLDKESYLNWLIKNRLAPHEYFALSFINKTDPKQPAIVLVSYSKDGKTWKELYGKNLGGKQNQGLIKGIDITNHNWGLLQGFVYDFNDWGFKQLYGFKSNSFLWNNGNPGFVAKFAGPPSTVIHKNAYQFIVSNIKNKLKVYQSKLRAPLGFNEVQIPEKCQTSIILRPDLAWRGKEMLIVWRTDSKVCKSCLKLSVLMGLVDATDGLKEMKCCSNVMMPEFNGKLLSSPALGCDGSLYYMGIIVLRKNKPGPELAVLTSKDGCTWQWLDSVPKLKAGDYKLGLAVNNKGVVLVAVLIKDKNGNVSHQAWLREQDQTGNWSWIYLAEKPWVKKKPAYKEFGLDAGGVPK